MTNLDVTRASSVVSCDGDLHTYPNGQSSYHVTELTLSCDVIRRRRVAGVTAKMQGQLKGEEKKNQDISSMFLLLIKIILAFNKHVTAKMHGHLKREE